MTQLFEPGQIGKLSIRNKLIMPPMLMGYASADGYVTDRMVDYYEERAKGGVGMVIVEALGVRKAGKVFPFSTDCFDESHLPGLSRLASAIKKHGARAAVQIGDGGRNTRPELTGEQPIAPSPIPTHKRDQPRVLTVEDIRDFVQKFANSIHLAKRAGFEGAELHGCHVYFLNQFLSAACNSRTDQYGGSVENRARILVEIIEAARKLVGQDFPIWVRLNAEEPGETIGITIEQTMEISQICERAGFDAISVSCGGAHYEASMGSMYFDEGYLVPFAEKIKQVVSIPVIVVGRIPVQLAQKVIADKRSDFVAIGRGLMVDPELPRKAQQGKFSDIMPCTACMNCVHRGVLRDTPITCAVNPALGRERELALTPAPSRKRVLVIGGGPAGLEAARVTARRGHQVTLVEAGKQLGGQMRLMGVAPHKEPMIVYIDYMAGQLAKLEVDVRLETCASTQLVDQIKPDVVIVATGQTPRFDASAQATGHIIRLQDLLSGKAKAGSRVAIIGDDDMAAESADLLSEQGKAVTIAYPGRKLAPAVLNLIRSVLLRRLSDKKVVQMGETQLVAVAGKSVIVAPKEGQQQTIDADTIILGNNFSVDTGLLSQIAGKVERIHILGGGRNVGDYQDAIAGAYAVARVV